MTPEGVVAAVLGVDESDVSDESSNENLEDWDSLAHMNIVTELEAVFGIALSAENALDMTSVKAIKRILAEHGVTW